MASISDFASKKFWGRCFLIPVPTDSVFSFGTQKACAKFREDRLKNVTTAVLTDTHAKTKHAN